MLGQNGAGKSTLIKVLAGAHQPDAGSIRWNGEEVRFASPLAALRHGVATIYQELDLVDGLSVAENIYLGHEVSADGFTRARPAARRHPCTAGATRPLRDPDARREVGRLSAAGKQIVSIARALSYDAKVIVMDEPSAVLAHDEVANLFRVIRDLAAGGVAVVYISHRLDEIREIGDRVTVLKDGHTVATAPAGQDDYAPRNRHAHDRSRHRVSVPAEGSSHGRRRSQPSCCASTGCRARGEFENVSFAVARRRDRRHRRAGRLRPVRTPRDGLRRSAALRRNGARFSASDFDPGRCRVRSRTGMGLAPEERKSQALFMRESIATNMTAASLPRYSRFSFLNRRA